MQLAYRAKVQYVNEWFEVAICLRYGGIFDNYFIARLLLSPVVKEFWKSVNICHSYGQEAPCGLRGCKNWPAPFPGRMSYKATKPGLVSVLYPSMCMVLLFIRAPFYVLLVFIAMCAVCWLFWLRYQYLPSDCLERLLFCVSLGSWVISLTVLGASVTNLNEPPRALATSTIAWVRS